MLRIYLKIAWRNIVLRKVYSTLNILGLSLGICACFVIYLISSYEFGFDAFHPDKERIYRVMGEVTESTGEKLHYIRLPIAVSPNMGTSLPGITEVTSLIPLNAKVSIPAGDRPAVQFVSMNGSFISTVITEPAWFDIFKYEWLAGSAAISLKAPFRVVLTECRAKQYFGNIAPDKMIGKQVVYEDSLPVTVSGIVRDWKGDTDLGFTDFISSGTLQNSFLINTFNPSSWKEADMSAWVFTKLSPGAKPAQVNSQLAKMVGLNTGPDIELYLWLEPLAEIHFNADVIENPIRTAHLPTLYALMGIALFILILAVINFINLSTAQSIRRAREVGIRKVLGSSRASLIFQFLTETLLLTFLSVLLAVFFVAPVLALFRSFIPSGVTFNLLDRSTILFLIFITLVTILFAGLYPAKVLSGNIPALSLKGEAVVKGGEKWLLMKGLIVFQFSVSLVFIIGSIVISQQLRYTREKDLGFRTDAIITTEAPRGDSASKLTVFAQKIMQLRGVNKVALQWIPPMTVNSKQMRLKFKTSDVAEAQVTQVDGDQEYIPLYGIRLIAGRNLVKSDSVNEFVINESLSRLMGYQNSREAIGKTVYWNDKLYPVVGVVADFHTSSLHAPITPLCIINRPDREGSLAIRLASKGVQSAMVTSTLAQIANAWKEIYPSKPFDYRFYDESVALLYEKDRQTAMLTNVTMAITIFISWMGLFGLALFTAEKKAKEISIRKILGASAGNIAAMLSREFVMLVVIALFIASPIAWYIMRQWLQGFAYRIQISGWVFLCGGLSALLITLLTISFQAIRAAFANPVKNLRRE